MGGPGPLFGRLGWHIYISVPKWDSVARAAAFPQKVESPGFMRFPGFFLLFCTIPKWDSVKISVNVLKHSTIPKRDTVLSQNGTAKKL